VFENAVLGKIKSCFFYHVLKYHMKILLRDCNAALGVGGGIFQPTIRNESLHQNSNGSRLE
jgi:hypothetical protein